MIKQISILLIFQLLSCNGQKKTDLSKLYFNEPIENITNYKDSLLIGVETFEYPFSLLLEVRNGKNYTFNGISLENQRVIFRINSEKLKTDSIIKRGGAHINMVSLKNTSILQKTLKNFDAINEIYGVNIEMNTEKLKKGLLEKLESNYGKGTKNLNTENGLYWNIKNKYIFFAPDYDRLIVLNNSDISKTCYSDTFNGTIDFGNCNFEEYTQNLTINTTKVKDIKNKPKILIDKNWNINGLIVGKSNESDFLKLSLEDSKKLVEFDLKNQLIDLIYRDEYHKLTFQFLPKKDILNLFFIQDLDKVDVEFENKIKGRMTYEEITKRLDKEKIKYTGYKPSSINIETNNNLVILRFKKSLFSSLIIKKN